MPEYIEREALLETLKNCRDAHADVDDADGCELIEDVMREIIEQASADVAPVVHGRWLDGRCTVCGWEEPDEIGYDGYEFSPWEHTNYCPNCGVKMEGDTENETDRR